MSNLLLKGKILLVLGVCLLLFANWVYAEEDK